MEQAGVCALLLVVLAAAAAAAAAAAGRPGEPCHHLALDVEGDCRKAWHCPDVRRRKASNPRYSAQFCGDKLVCCPPPLPPPEWAAAVMKEPPACVAGRARASPTGDNLLKWVDDRRKDRCALTEELIAEMNVITHIPANASVIERKCLAYLLQEFQDENNPALLAGQEILCKRDCSNERGVPFVVGGEDSEESEFPHMALFLDERGDPFCAGSLISEDFVLTAAHCAVPARVLLGTIHADPSGTINEEMVVEARVREHIVHPDFYWSGGARADIALLRLDQPVRFTTFVRPACLYTGRDADLREAVVTGWGYKHYDSAEDANVSSTAEPSEILQRATLRIVPHGECVDKWDGETVHEQHICALGQNSTTKEFADACKGDSGGPMQVAAPGSTCSYHVVAVVSKGRGCGTRLPGLYTSVAKFADWIQSWVWPCED